MKRNNEISNAGKRAQHAIIPAIGTDGDIYPFIGLGTELRARGYQVTIATHEHFAACAEAAGLAFVPLVSASLVLALCLFADKKTGFSSAVQPEVGFNRVQATSTTTVQIGSMKKQIVSISILHSSKILTGLYFLFGFTYILIGIPMIIFGNQQIKIIGSVCLFMPMIMAVFGFLFIAIFAAMYNLLAKWLGGFEVEVKDMEPEYGGRRLPPEVLRQLITLATVRKEAGVLEVAVTSAGEVQAR